MKRYFSRRNMLIGGGAAVGGLLLSKLPVLAQSDSYRGLLRAGDFFNMHAQRLAMIHRPLAPEYRRNQISANHPTVGGIGASYIDPNPPFHAMFARRFSDWRLSVGGLVRRPLRLSLPEIRALPVRSQITMHSCDEGWSAIAEWTGVQLGRIIGMAGPLENARYVVFRCLDTIGGVPYWGSIDMLDAVHPQTILAYAINGQDLPVGHGAPLRLRIELQIGYKNLKHLHSIELVESLGGGGSAEALGFQWYAGL